CSPGRTAHPQLPISLCFPADVVVDNREGRIPGRLILGLVKEGVCPTAVIIGNRDLTRRTLGDLKATAYVVVVYQNVGERRGSQPTPGIAIQACVFRWSFG